jgi:hypothetical protein
VGVGSGRWGDQGPRAEEHACELTALTRSAPGDNRREHKKPATQDTHRLTKPKKGHHRRFPRETSELYQAIAAAQRVGKLRELVAMRPREFTLEEKRTKERRQFRREVESVFPQHAALMTIDVSALDRLLPAS